MMVNPTQKPDGEPTLSDVIQALDVMSNEVKRIDNFGGDIDYLRNELKKLSSDIDQRGKWEDRTWDVIKWVAGISAGLSISAAIAILGLAIRAAIQSI